jgi:hypothetical protein
VNTDRLIRAIESRVSNIVRKENSEIRKLLEKLGEDTLRIENGLNSLKNDVKFIQDNIQGKTTFKSLLIHTHELFEILHSCFKN